MNMSVLLPILLVGAALALVIVLKKLDLVSARGPETFPYGKADALFTPTEREFLAALESVVGNRYRVMGKIRLADVVSVRKNLSAGMRQSAFNRIKSKHVDFVLCDPTDLTIQAVIELDDSSHRRADRRKRDAFLNQTLQAANIPIFHIPAQATYSPDQLRNTLFTQDEKSESSPPTSELG